MFSSKYWKRQRINIFRKSGIYVLAYLSCIGLVNAHHGTAINYDWDQTVPLQGTVTEFIWRNPHAALFLDVRQEDGTTINYAIELTSPVMMARSSCGWTRDTFKLGDDVLFPVHPSRTNQPVVAGLGQCEDVIVNGKTTKK